VKSCGALACDQNPSAPPYLPFCARHWFLVPADLRRALLVAYRPHKRLSKGWHLAFQDAREALAVTERRATGVMVLLRIRKQVTELRVNVA